MIYITWIDGWTVVFGLVGAESVYWCRVPFRPGSWFGARCYFGARSDNYFPFPKAGQWRASLMVVPPHGVGYLGLPYRGPLDDFFPRGGYNCRRSDTGWGFVPVKNAVWRFLGDKSCAAKTRGVTRLGTQRPPVVSKPSSAVKIWGFGAKQDSFGLGGEHCVCL